MSRWCAVTLPCVGHEPTCVIIDTNSSTCTATLTDWAEAEAVAAVLNRNESFFNEVVDDARIREPF